MWRKRAAAEWYKTREHVLVSRKLILHGSLTNAEFSSAVSKWFKSWSRWVLVVLLHLPCSHRCQRSYRLSGRWSMSLWTQKPGSSSVHDIWKGMGTPLLQLSPPSTCRKFQGLCSSWDAEQQCLTLLSPSRPPSDFSPPAIRFKYKTRRADVSKASPA